MTAECPCGAHLLQLTIFGSGYVGLVQGACMAEMGTHVVCYDFDEDTIARLKKAKPRSTNRALRLMSSAVWRLAGSSLRLMANRP